jgi:hypothetical protein
VRVAGAHDLAGACHPSYVIKEASVALTNAEKQERWRKRNQVVLTDSAKRIAAKLIAMDDEDKLRKIASYVNDHLNGLAATMRDNERKQ